MRNIILAALLVVVVQARPQFETDFGAFGFASLQLGNSAGNPFQGGNFLDLFRKDEPQVLEGVSDFQNALGEAVERYADDASFIARAAVASIGQIFEYSIESFLVAVNELRIVVKIIIQQTKDNLERDGWQSIGDRLNRVSSAAQELQIVNEAVRKIWSTELEDEANDSIDKWNDWASEVYDNASLSSQSQEYKVVQETLNDYVNTYTGYLNECIDSVKEDLFSFQKKVQKAADNYKSLMGDLFEQIQNCLNSSSVSCQRSVNVLLRKFSETPRTLKKLTAEGKALSVPYEQIECIKQTLNEAENEKNELQNEIYEFVQRENSA